MSRLLNSSIDFYFNFTPNGELEPAASHHNARMVAAICRKHFDGLHDVLTLMPPSCCDNQDDQEGHRRSVTLNHVMLLGFCSQGLARSPAHRRLQHATLAAELFIWVTKAVPDRQIPPIRSERPRLQQTVSPGPGKLEQVGNVFDALTIVRMHSYVNLISCLSNGPCVLSDPLVRVLFRKMKSI